MKTFTIKDFVAYNNPCRMCGSKVSLSLVPVGHNETGSSSGIYPMFRKNLLYFNLWLKYKEKLAITIDPVTHHFSLEGASENLRRLMEEYKSENHLMFDITCSYCKTQILSEYLEFKGTHIKPLRLFQETLNAKTENYNYQIVSYHNEDRSFVKAEKIKKPFVAPFVLETPLLPLIKIKTRENIIKKIKLYMVLS